MQERRRQARRKMGFYFPVFDTNTRELFGHLTDVTMVGFRLDCVRVIPTNTKFQLSIETPAEVSDVEFIDLTVRCIWCRKDSAVPNFFNVGFSILEISSHDSEVLQRVVEQYGNR